MNGGARPTAAARQTGCARHTGTWGRETQHSPEHSHALETARGPETWLSVHGEDVGVMTAAAAAAAVEPVGYSEYPGSS